MSGEYQPVLRVVRGRPDDAELAAVTATVLALAASSAGTDDGQQGTRRAGAGWRDRGWHQQGWRGRPGAWQAAGRPAA